MPNEFVVFCEARTGSYSLVSRLGSAADIVCHGEIFKKDRIEVSPFHQRRLSGHTIAARNAAPDGFIRAARAINPHKHFGFKLFLHHLNWAPEAVGYLTAPETRRIILWRDPLEVYASGLRARATGIWTVRSARAERRDALDAPVRYEPATFDTFVAHYNRFVLFTRVLAALPGSFVVHYPQINDPAALDALFRFVGSRASAAESRTEYRKQFRGRLEDGFENWDALAARLEGGSPFVAPPPPSHPGAAADAVSAARG